MASDDTGAMAEARQAAEKERPTDRLVERLVEGIGGRTGVETLFGEPVERSGTTIVPVARVRWFAGAGAGSGPVSADDTQLGSGSGGGGGAIADPVGYLEMGPTEVRFRPIMGLPPSPLVILAVGLSVALVLRAVARLLGR